MHSIWAITDPFITHLTWFSKSSLVLILSVVHSSFSGLTQEVILLHFLQLEQKLLEEEKKTLAWAVIVTTKTRKQTAWYWPHHCPTGKWSPDNEHWSTEKWRQEPFRFVSHCCCSSYYLHAAPLMASAHLIQGNCWQSRSITRWSVYLSCIFIHNNGVYKYSIT